MYKKDLLLRIDDILSLPITEWADDFNFTLISDYVNYLYNNPLLPENKLEAIKLINYIGIYNLIDNSVEETLDEITYWKYKELKILVAKLYYIILDVLSKEGLMEYLDKYLVESIGLKDVRYRFKVLLESFYEEDGSWEVREKVLKKIFSSEQLIGSVGLNIGKNFENVSPTIHNWILDYLGRAGDTAGTAIGIVSYFNQSQNVANLSQDDATSLKKIIELYDFIKNRLENPIDDPDMIILQEEVQQTDQKLQELISNIEIENEKASEEEGVFEEGVKNENKAPVITTAVGQSGILSAPAQPKEPEYTIDDLHKEYGLYISRHPEARAREQMINQTIGNNKASAVALMQEYIDAKDVTGIHALLRVTAQSGIILDLIVADAKYAREYWGNITTLFGEQYANRDSFLKKPAPYLSIFIQWISRVVLGLEAIEASFIGVDIYNILVAVDSASFEKLMYADITAKQFRWRRIGKNKETLGFK